MTVSRMLCLACLAGASNLRAAPDVYSSVSDFATTQGHRNWYYLNWDGEAYEPMIYGPNWWGSPSWHGYCPGHCVTDCTDSALYANSSHPNICGAQPTRAWESPLPGMVRITGNARKASSHIGGGDGVSAFILKNGELLWSADVAYNDATGFNFDLTVPVATGDRLYFRVGPLGNPNYDLTVFNPTIVASWDTDNDGLLDDDETGVYSTNPLDPDTDDDGLLDGVEVHDTLTSPLSSDTDGDGLIDGAEVGLGTNPNNPDTDGDGVGDSEDPTPLDPGVPGSWIEFALRDMSVSEVLGLDLALISAPNNNARAGRRNAMSNKLAEAANLVAADDRLGAIEELTSLLAKLDGEPSPPDWMVDGVEKSALAAEVELMIYLLLIP